MYLGRIVAIGMTPQGKAAAMYRVSSRSFPNREAVLVNNQISILPRAGFESDLRKNPYISYNCVRLAGEWAVATNGSQTDPIVEKIAMDFPPRDAISLGLLAMDYEKDSLDTPRIVAAVSNKRPVGYLGIIRKEPAAGPRVHAGARRNPLPLHLREEPPLRRPGRDRLRGSVRELRGAVCG